MPIRPPTVRRPRSAARLVPASLALLLALGAAGCETLGSGTFGPALSDDQPTSQAVRDALAGSPETMFQRILVKTTESGRVRLSGFVDTEATRQTAEELAERVPGVLSVINTLQVRDG